MWWKEHSICTLLMIEQTLIALAFTRGQPKLTKLWKKTCPHRQHVTFHAGHAESTIPLNSENWVHELLIPQVQYYPPAPTNMKKHLKVTSDEEKLVSLLCEWVLIDHGFRDRTLLPAHSLAKKSLKQLLTDPHEHSQTCFLYFRGRESIGEDGFLARSTKADEKFKYRLYTARNNCYNRRITTKLRRARSSIHHENNHTGHNWGQWRKQAKFGVSLVYFLALFLSRFKCAFFNDLWGSTATPWSPYLKSWSTELCICSYKQSPPATVT